MYPRLLASREQAKLFVSCDLKVFFLSLRLVWKMGERRERSEGEGARDESSSVSSRREREESKEDGV